MKRRFRWWLSAVLLYLVSVPIIIISIGLFSYLVINIWVAVNGLVGAAAAGYSWLMIYFMIFIGIPLSLLSSFFVPPFVLGSIRKRRLRRLKRTRR